MTKPHVLRTFVGLSLFLGLFFCYSAAGLAQTAGSRPENLLNPISWLVGRWTAVELGANGIAVTIQLDVQWIDNQSAIQVSSMRIPAGGTPTPQYRATFKWDPQKKKIVMTRIDTNGDRFEGDVEPAGNDFELTGRLTRAGGSTQQLRYSYNSWSPGTFALETSSQDQRLLDTAVTPSLVFLRQKPSPNSGDPARVKEEGFLRDGRFIESPESEFDSRAATRLSASNALAGRGIYQKRATPPVLP